MSVKIIKLQAENFKRLKAVEVTPDGFVQIVGGNNSQGKSSLLDAIFLALGGGKAAKTVATPIRHGEDHASVAIDFGDFTVLKEWKNDKTTLKIESKDGAKYSNAQTFLDQKLGAIAFDPLIFTRMDTKEQKAELLKLVKLDINLEANAIARQKAYESRTDTNRQVKDLKAQLEGLGKLEDAPAEIVTSQEILLEIEKQYQIKDKWNSNRERLENADEKILLLQQQLKAAEAERAILLDNPVEVPDLQLITSLQGRLSEVESINDKVRKNTQIRELTEKIAYGESVSANWDAEIATLDKAKTDALAQASFPVAGLSFDESGVLFNGLPLSDASDSEKIRVAIGIAMALNSEIRIIRIADGSLLDSNTLALISEMAKDKDYQLWIETVGDNGVGIIIEDGEVVKDYSK